MFGSAGVSAEVIWSSNLKYIGNNAFWGCPFFFSEQALCLPLVLSYIGADAFNGCKRFTSISFPNSIVKIDSHVFA